MGRRGEWCDLPGAPEGTCVQQHCPRRGWRRCYILLFGGCRKSYFPSAQSRDSSASFVPVEGAWTRDFSAPFTGSRVAAAVIALGKAVPSFLTFVKMYENQGGLDSRPHLFFIRNKQTQSFLLFGPTHPLENHGHLADRDWMGLYMCFKKCNRLKEEEHLYDTVNLRIVQVTFLCNFW